MVAPGAQVPLRRARELVVPVAVPPGVTPVAEVFWPLVVASVAEPGVGGTLGMGLPGIGGAVGDKPGPTGTPA
jgi:hypothetical protein